MISHSSTFFVLYLAGDGLPDMATQDEVLKALESVGFEVQGPPPTSMPHSTIIQLHEFQCNVAPYCSYIGQT